METIQWIGDVVALCMCAVTVLYLVQQTIRSKRGLTVRSVAGIIGNFNQELGRFIKAGREPLVSLRRLEDLENVSAKTAVSRDEVGADPVPDPLQDANPARKCIRDSEISEPGDRYGEVKRLADMGLDKEEIFERVGLPKGEIELVLKLKRLRSGSGENVRAGNSFLASSL